MGRRGDFIAPEVLVVVVVTIVVVVEPPPFVVFVVVYFDVFVAPFKGLDSR